MGIACLRPTHNVSGEGEVNSQPDSIRFSQGRGDQTPGVVYPAKENICAIVVTYFPDDGLVSRLTRTKPQVDRIVIVDNASDAESLVIIEKASASPDVNVIRNPENLGIARALNQGMTWARSHGYKWALLLDQDTVMAPEMVATWIEVFADCPNRAEIAIIGSNRFLNSDSQSNPSGVVRWKPGKTVITSGSLIRVESAERIGPFREEFFIDCVDFEFCLRARRRGFYVIEVLVPMMEHYIGSPKTVRVLWSKIQLYNHRPWRSYYMIRNFVILAREYLVADPWWVFRMSSAMTRIVIVTLLMEKSRTLKARHMFLGFCDGLSARFTRNLNREAPAR